MSLFQKKVAERKTQQQLETELGALKDALVGLKDAETALAKTDFVYESEITAIGRMRNVLAERVTSL